MSVRGDGGGSIQYIQLVGGVFSCWGERLLFDFSANFTLSLSGPPADLKKKKKKVMSV